MNCQHRLKSFRSWCFSQHQRVQSILTEKDKLQREVIIAKQQAIELTSTVEAQRKRAEHSEHARSKELLQALRGKKRERLDPNQLLLFDLGELEKLLEEAATTSIDVQTMTWRHRSHRRKKRSTVDESFPTICRRKRFA